MVSAKLGLAPVGQAWMTYKFLSQLQWQGGVKHSDLVGQSQASGWT